MSPVDFVGLVWLLFAPGGDYAVTARHECQAVMVCGGDTCEAYVLPDTCTGPWSLEACLAAGAEVPGDDAADVLGCGTGAVPSAVVDWSPADV